MKKLLSDEETVKITVLESTNKPPVLFVKFEVNSSHNGIPLPLTLVNN
jgi:hypothetical protein